MMVAPWFEDFKVGDEFNDVPSVTITEGYAAIHQSVFGDRSRLTVDQPLCKQVTGSDRLLVNPALVCNIAIGQSTIPSQRVMGNLFYRGLRFHRQVFIGDTLTTRTKVIALRQNTIKPGRAASGMVALEIHVANQRDETVMLFWRCPMVPCRDAEADTGHQDDFSVMPEAIDDDELVTAMPKWDLEPMANAIAPVDYQQQQIIPVEARDSVTSAPEIVRLTLNMAMTHTDAARSVYGKRLVYGGHTISTAAAQLSRAMPDLVTILAWYKCDHLAPVFEQDILESVITIEEVFNPIQGPQGRMAKLKIEVFADRGIEAPKPDKKVAVLDWRLAVLLN